MKNISFLLENFQFLEVKFSTYLNRHAFVLSLSGYLGQVIISFLFCWASKIFSSLLRKILNLYGPFHAKNVSLGSCGQ